jgi:hypothetical protein
LETKAVIVLPDWPKFKALTKELELIKQIPKGEKVFMRTSPTGTYVPSDLLPSLWPVNFWLIDASTPVVSPPLITTVNNSKPSIVETESELRTAIEAANEYLPEAAALTIMNPYEAAALMRFTASVSHNGVTSQADALIDTAASLNFVSKDFVISNGFYKGCKTVLKLSIRVASEQRISTTKLFCPTTFTIDGHDFTDLQFRVLPHFKGSDIILGLPALKKLEVSIHPSLDSFTVGDFTVQCNRESRKISCLIVDTDKMNQIITKQARNKKDPVDVFLISLHFAEELATVKSDFGEQFDRQLKHLITEFADVTEEPQGLPPHRGHLDHKVKLTGYPPRQRRNRLSLPEYEELKRQCTQLFKEGKVRISKSPYAAPIVMVRKSDGSIRVCIDYRAINERTVKDSFPLPRIDDLIDQLRDAACITHLDLRSAYNQVRMSDDGPSDDSIAATTFQGLTPNGSPCLLEMLVMGFGLCNAPATFTRLMTHVLDPFIHKFVIVYLDDICIYSKTPEEHLDHIRQVLTALRNNKLFI